MTVKEVYFQTELALDQLALRLKEVLNLPEENRTSYLKNQHRSSLNKGGAYYLFEVLGLTLELISNTGEVEIPERSGWNYYLLIYSNDIGLDENNISTLANHICAVLRKDGLNAEVDQLSC